MFFCYHEHAYWFFVWSNPLKLVLKVITLNHFDQKLNQAAAQQCIKNLV